MTINYNFYASVSDYMRRNVSLSGNYYSNKLTLLRGALIVGLAPKSNLMLPKEVIEWKLSTVIGFVDYNPTSFEIKNTYLLETSEKVTVAYFLGMVFAQIYMQSHYGVRHLEHLKNRSILATSLPGDNKNPDLWGLNNRTMVSYLVEAKGSTKKSDYFDNGNVTKAESQLGAVTQIDYTASGKGNVTFNQISSNLNKLIIATHPNMNREVTQHVIDPIDGEQKIIKVNGDELIYKYYSNLIKIIKEESSDIIEVLGLEFRVIELKKFDFSIGVIEDIYKLLESKVSLEQQITMETVTGLNQTINKMLDNLELKLKDHHDNDKTSVGIDGIIVLSK
ncbi:hypothetical protein [Paenibacillus glacialis]|uniref:Uncharacterized protein n=1 Tax=Paenibacillus glacialis TaxID=494026 RepID=A0A168C2P2_9BACL|nr:hypothetical protein [Paenibacillus glacialis]OAB32991.1 hypothetical protein PGLA_26290 [Paenibacillus glacialis]